MSNSRRPEVQGAVVLSMYAVSDSGRFHIDDKDTRKSV